MKSHPSKPSVFSFYFLCLKRAGIDSLNFFKLRDLASWIKLGGPPVLTFVALWFLLGPESVSKQIPTWLAALLASFGWALIVFLVHIILAPHRMHNESTSHLTQLEAEVEKLQEAQKPRLAILFQSQDTYIQGTSPHFLYRICVQNLSTVSSVESVSVELTNIKPYRPPLLPMKLHLMHDNPLDGIYQDTFDLSPGEYRFIDVLEVQHHNVGIRFAIKHIVRNIAPYIAGRVEGLTVVARGKNCPSAGADFQLVEQNGIYRFSML